MEDPWSDSVLAALAGVPSKPSKFTKRYLEGVVARCNRRISVLEQRIDGVANGRVMPDVDDVTIGSGKRFKLSVLFLDICNFSGRSNETLSEQHEVLRVMNVFMAEMLNVVRDFGGHYEKNTGDDLMAYFGDGETSTSAIVKPAAEAAVVMHFINDEYLTPWFQSQGILPVRFRIGIEVGEVTIARVGIHGSESDLVAIGSPANISNKIMKLIPNGGICLGNAAKGALPLYWDRKCVQIQELTGCVFKGSTTPYPAWELSHRLTQPLF